MDRRKFLLVSGATAATTLMDVRPVYAWDLKHTPESVYDNFSRALWASTNRKSQKAAYVLAAPWCSVTRRFYQAIRDHSPDCDFRFVWQNDRSEHQTKIVYSTYFQEGNNQLVPYENDTPTADNVAPGPLGLASGINEAMLSSVGPHMRPFVTGGGGTPTQFGFGYPTVIFKSKGVVKAVTGMPPDVLGLAASIDSGLTRTAPTPQLLAAVKAPLTLYKTKEGNRFARKDGCILYSAPLEDAPVVETLARGRGYPAYVETDFGGQDWLALKAFGGTWPLLWAKLEYFK